MVLASWLDDSTTLPNPWLARNISEKVENLRKDRSGHCVRLALMYWTNMVLSLGRSWQGVCLQ